MNNKKRGRPAKIKAHDLRHSGYAYKMDNLTEDEEKELKEGRKIVEDGKTKTYESRDFDFFYKEMDGITIQIFHVSGDFFYKGVKLKSTDQLQLIEKDAVTNAYYQELQKQVQDTKPIPQFEIEIKQQSTEGRIADKCGTNTQLVQGYFNDTISLIGGPLDGLKRTYLTAMPFYMEQVEITIPGTTPPAKAIIAARYKRSENDRTMYIHDPSII